MNFTKERIVINNEKRGATNAPKNDSYMYNSKALQGLQEVRDIALYLAGKYRWDPMLGQAHEEYLNILNKILVECKGE